MHTVMFWVFFVCLFLGKTTNVWELLRATSSRLFHFAYFSCYFSKSIFKCTCYNTNAEFISINWLGLTRNPKLVILCIGDVCYLCDKIAGQKQGRFHLCCGLRRNHMRRKTWQWEHATSDYIESLGAKKERTASS